MLSAEEMPNRLQDRHDEIQHEVPSARDEVQFRAVCHEQQCPDAENEEHGFQDAAQLAQKTRPRNRYRQSTVQT